MIELVDYTPIEQYEVRGRPVWVKREDMSCLPPGPPFSKIRGLYECLVKWKQQGCSVVGYTETSVSMAGIGVAWVAKHLGMKAVIFDPQYRQEPDLLKLHRSYWKFCDAELVPIKAGMAKVNYYLSFKILRQQFGPEARMLELGLPLEETLQASARQWRWTMSQFRPATTVVAVGSGTICAGLLRGWFPGCGIIIGVLTRKGNINRKLKSIEARAWGDWYGAFGTSPLRLVDEGWEYAEFSKADCPFACHRYYDLKAWEWLVNNLDDLEPPVLFWNIGREIEPLDQQVVV